MTAHRKISAPYAGRIDDDGHKVCPWCDVWSREKRRVWHPSCATTYRIANYSADQRRACFARDNGICKGCGVDTKTLPLPQKWHEGYAHWQADHILPLWLVDRSKPGWQRYYGLENLQTLCNDCHKVKSAREAAERAKMKRLIAKADPNPKPKRVTVRQATKWIGRKPRLKLFKPRLAKQIRRF